MHERFLLTDVRKLLHLLIAITKVFGNIRKKNYMMK